jgi:hypothetical protein
MPQVITDPSLNPGVVTQSTSIFDYPDTPAPSILNFQVNPTQPLPSRTSTGTGLLFPDLMLYRRLVNFPEQIWTLTAGSLLVRFMSALLGPSGAGQLRQRQQVSRLQSAIAGTHFYDLDAFYGALFSARRTDAAALPLNPSTGVTFNPYTDLATQDGWDDIRATDAIYRERVIQLARAISMGGTVPGIQAMAEAIVRVPCRVYETGQLITLQGAESLSGNTWAYIQESYLTWTSISGQYWSALQATVSYGGLTINALNEVVIQPQKTYKSDLASQQQAVADASGILDVVRVLAPAFALVSVDTTGALVDRPVPIAGLSSDADYWEVIAKVSPPQPSVPPYVGYVTAYDRGGQKVDSALPMKPGVPPFSQGQGWQYSYASTVAQAFASTWEPVTSPVAVLEAPKNDSKNYETVHYPGGQVTSYLPSWGLADPAVMAAGRAASSTAMTAAPYSGPRQPVMTATL